MGTDAAPDDVRLASTQRFSERERCSAIVGPRELEDAGMASDALDAQAWAKAPALPEVNHERVHCCQEGALLVAREGLEVSVEPRSPIVGRQTLGLEIPTQ